MKITDYSHRHPEEKLSAALRGESFLLFDGAMGTMLQRAGLTSQGEDPLLLNLTHPDAIAAVHRAYKDAGAEVITTNTFGANALKLQGKAKAEAVISAAVRIARSSGAPLVAGDVGPLGVLLKPLGSLSFDDAYDLFAQQVDILVAQGCDLLVLETFTDLRELKAAVLAAKERSDLPVFATMSFGEKGRTFLGTPPEVAAITLTALGVQAVGVNCSLGPREVAPLVKAMAPHLRCPLIVQPNAGLPRMEHGQTFYDMTAEEFVADTEELLDSGATILGGCCGTDPAFISGLAAMLRQKAPMSLVSKPHFAVTGLQRSFVRPKDSHGLGIIGERINPTGNARLRKALEVKNYDVAITEAVAQEEAGADLLDVNAGIPGIDESMTLTELVEALQATTQVPLVIDSTRPEVLEAALRVYGGKPLINSVNGRAESLATVLPLAKTYGCAVIGLTLDEHGIPETAEERLTIASRIVDACEAAGIPRSDVVIDCLVMAAATNQEELPEIIRAVSLIKRELGVSALLGVSNVSFGLPQRDLVNAAFLAVAFGAGLDLAIVNPVSQPIRETIDALRLFIGEGNTTASFLARYGSVKRVMTQEPIEEQVVSSECLSGEPPAATLFNLVVNGQKEEAAHQTTLLLREQAGMAIATDILIPALDEAGLRYDRGDFFLPQLMASAEAMKAAFDEIRATSPEVADDRGETVVLATVQGDIHDIGKNIVKMLLENYGYHIIDLGFDVSPETVVEAARASKAKLVGLSALMTTTLGAMKRTIELLHEQVPGTSVIVGGAVLTPEYAASLGADFYSKDAAECARLVSDFFTKGNQNGDNKGDKR